MNDRQNRQLVKDALGSWANSWPRRVTRYQRWATSFTEASALLLECERNPDNSPFISTYSFPNGHPQDNNIPRIDRLFFDMDVPDETAYRSGDTDESVWIRDMSKLLVRVRKVARFLSDSESLGSWQASLSGHKGVHLDLVFPPIDTRNGTFAQFDQGMIDYANQITEYLIDQTNMTDLDEYIDVSSADMARTRRVPNTLHGGATESFGEDRFCVPVTLQELANIKPADYIDLTQSRRPVTGAMRATPNEKAGEVLAQHIRTVSASTSTRSRGRSEVNYTRIEDYYESQNDAIGVEDVAFVLSDRPCVKAFVERDDAFTQQAASHLMEMKAITEMMAKGVPVEIEYDNSGRANVVGGTMVDFFSETKGFDKKYTCERIEQYISRQYQPVSCEKIWDQADDFCLHDNCKIWVDASEQNR